MVFATHSMSPLPRRGLGGSCRGTEEREHDASCPLPAPSHSFILECLHTLVCTSSTWSMPLIHDPCLARAPHFVASNLTFSQSVASSDVLSTITLFRLGYQERSHIDWLLDSARISCSTIEVDFVAEYSVRDFLNGFQLPRAECLWERDDWPFWPSDAFDTAQLLSPLHHSIFLSTYKYPRLQ